jgi:F0F1-type ATP synthase membrane subunit a
VKKAVIAAIAAVAVIGWLGIGLLIARGPQPEIIVPAEIITRVGPLNISNTLITSWMSMVVIIGLSLAATRGMKMVPSGVQNFVEAVIEFLLDQVESVAGTVNGRRFFAVVATFFIFIIVSNWMGLLPFFNAIGKTEDVGAHIFHEIVDHAEAGEPFEEDEHFAAWFMENAGGVAITKPGGEAVEFEIPAGTSAGEALDRYIVFLAESFTDFHRQGEEEHAAPTAEEVKAALAALEADPKAPKLVTAPAEGEHGSEAGGHGEGHGVESPALHAVVTDVEFPGQKLALVIPLFRSAFSDINNTLALGFCSFLIVEFFGFRSLGIGYLRKFFNFSNPVLTFVGLLELVSEFIRIISFAFRLFGNIFAGEVLIVMLTFLMPFLLVDVIYGLELFVGFIQAAVFALLTLVFLVMAVEHHGDEHEHEGHGEHQPTAAGAHHG